jgi:hypothetical protein
LTYAGTFLYFFISKSNFLSFFITHPAPLKNSERGGSLKMHCMRSTERVVCCFGSVLRKRISLYLLMIWYLAVMGIGFGGCASRYSSLDHMEGLFVEHIHSSRVSLSNIVVGQEGDELVISGEVRRLNTAFSGMGHVDVAVVSPGGAVINQVNAAYTPKILPKTPGARKHRPSRFLVRMYCAPPKGSTIRVAYHGKPAEDDPLLDCEDNLAVPHDHDHGG